jgi:hypothetical protein
VIFIQFVFGLNDKSKVGPGYGVIQIKQYQAALYSNKRGYFKDGPATGNLQKQIKPISVP